MTKEQIKRVLPFINAKGKGFSPKSKLIIFLLANNYAPAEIRNLTYKDIANIKDIRKIPELESCFDLLISNVPDEKVFVYTSGREYTEAYIVSILQRSFQKAGLKYRNLDDFKKRIYG